MVKFNKTNSFLPVVIFQTIFAISFVFILEQKKMYYIYIYRLNMEKKKNLYNKVGRDRIMEMDDEWVDTG